MQKNLNILAISFNILIATIVLVVLCYFFVDKFVAFWLYHHLPQGNVFLLKLSQIPGLFVPAALLCLIYYVIKVYLSKNILRLESCLYHASLAISVSASFKEILKTVFGRTWPLPWVDGNNALIGSHTYGFFWFHDGKAYTSFPSGHLTIAAAFFSMLCFYYPKLIWLWSLLTLLIAVAMLGMNYHFASDIIAGIGLGTLVGSWTYYIAKK